MRPSDNAAQGGRRLGQELVEVLLVGRVLAGEPRAEPAFHLDISRDDIGVADAPAWSEDPGRSLLAHLDRSGDAAVMSGGIPRHPVLAMTKDELARSQERADAKADEVADLERKTN